MSSLTKSEIANSLISAALSRIAYSCDQSTFSPTESPTDPIFEALKQKIPNPTIHCHTRRRQDPKTISYLTFKHQSILFVSFRGSAARADFQQNAYPYLIAVSQSAKGKIVRVHSGVYEMWRNSVPDTMTDLLDLNGISHVVFSGHSLGGGLAQLSAYNFACATHSARTKKRVKISCITFGAMSTGNGAMIEDAISKKVSFIDFLNEYDGLAQIAELGRKRIAVVYEGAYVKLEKNQVTIKDHHIETLPVVTHYTPDWITGSPVPVYSESDRLLFVTECDAENRRKILVKVRPDSSCLPSFKSRYRFRLYDRLARPDRTIDWFEHLDGPLDMSSFKIRNVMAYTKNHMMDRYIQGLLMHLATRRHVDTRYNMFNDWDCE